MLRAPVIMATVLVVNPFTWIVMSMLQQCFRSKSGSPLELWFGLELGLGLGFGLLLDSHYPFHQVGAGIALRLVYRS